MSDSGVHVTLVREGRNGPKSLADVIKVDHPLTGVMRYNCYLSEEARAELKAGQGGKHHDAILDYHLALVSPNAKVDAFADLLGQ